MAGDCRPFFSLVLNQLLAIAHSGSIYQIIICNLPETIAHTKMARHEKSV
jgi:hypothetical protein